MAATEKEFDAVALMRRLRDEIDRDVADMTPEQRHDYIRRRAERVRTELGLTGAVDQAAVSPAR